MNKTDLAYLAGIIDGEGHFVLRRRRGATKSRGSAQIHMSFSNTSPKIIEWVKERFDHDGTQVRQIGNPEQRQPIWYQFFYPNKLRKLLPQLLPYLVIKKDQALLVLRALELTEQSKGHTEEFALLEKQMREIRGFKRSRRTTLPLM